MTLAQIESAISHLPSQDLAALMRWLGGYVATQIDNDAWDKKIAADSDAGQLNAFIADAMQQVQAGKVSDL